MSIFKMKSVFILAVLLMVGLTVGCASRPRLYPNEKYEQVGAQAAEKDIDDCVQQAEAYLQGEKGRQVAKGAGQGAVMGGVIGGLFSGGLRGAARGAVAGGAVGGTAAALSPERLKQQYVNTCLSKKGYQVLGWN